MIDDDVELTTICTCGHERGLRDEDGCRGGEDLICHCDSFEEPEED